jgi:hypothetical protein
MKRFIFFALMLAPAWVFGQSVKITSEKGVKWDTYKSFSISQGDLVTVTKADVDKEPLLREIQKTIIEELTSRGLEHKAEGGALTIDFTGELVETTNVEEIGPLGQEPADEPVEMEQSRVWSQERKEGSLVIDAIDAKANKSIWRSSVSIDFAGEELPVIFNAAVGRSLKKFPGGND